ncbi:AfsR/SARP family transcriptional regulator [Solihabitans fulvus]|uniref:AfsR/SARP family transcriptional regulator n=1 Tax=Solihabitans fulvus TaxID=1892852 RepID=A0A5B2WWW3_9PSEU|nr:BTAD domain-containing putative transcriptional regulator [Solihabitans fulvus]KAA2255444.1 AfsR/SARP family transcriptional regulator [Solihabitans fulvus]
MQIGVLGPLEVRTDDGASVEVSGTRLRTLLIILALEPNRVVPAARLIDGIWRDVPPAGAANALQALVSRLRRAVQGIVVDTHPAGYRLSIAQDDVDAARFERLVAASARATDAETVEGILREALDLWRGPALQELAAEDFVAAQVARLTELRLTATETLVEADLALGHGAALVTDLTTLVAEHPLRERLVGALMRALCAADRPAEALAAYDRTRQALTETLGTDPSPALSALHTAILRGEVTAPPQRESTVDSPPRTNLRSELTTFVGRDPDLARVGTLIARGRLTTLTGPGGCGKTRLATEAARAHLGNRPDEVWLVELAPVASGADAAQAVLTALGVRDLAPPGQPPAGEPADRLVAALRDRTALLVLDNCEHLVDAVAALADRLLGECPRLRILATSREPLGITGEALWPVESLALPPEDAGATEALTYAAVRLLADRAASARPGFAVTADTAQAVARICRALDGMPLAIELAAARLRTMSVAHLAGRLDDRFRLLTNGSRTALPRHRTLRAVIDWSWDLLTDEERALLRRLAVFSRGATAAAAERVCAGGPIAADDVLELLTALAEKSLLTAVGDGSPRYQLLETIREYALRQLDEAGERDRIRRAHAACFIDLAETADPHLRRADQLVWLDRLAADRDNIDAALRGAIEAGDAPTSVRLVAAAGSYWLLDWWLRGRRSGRAELAAAALALPGAVEDETRATACAIALQLPSPDERAAGDLLATARRLAERTEPTGRRHPMLRLIAPRTEADAFADEDPWVRAMAHLSRALTLVNAGRDHARAAADLTEALTAFRAIGERWGISYTLTNLADLLAGQGDLASAAANYEQAIAVAAEAVPVADVWLPRLRLAQLRWLLGDQDAATDAVAAIERDVERTGQPDALASVAYVRACLARWSGDPGAARTQLARAESVMSRHLAVNVVFRVILLDSLGYLDASAGDLASAAAHRADALAMALRSTSAPLLGQVLVGVADLALCQGKPREAARLLAAGAAVRGAPDLSLPDAARVEAAARAALGDAEFAEAARRGRDATIETVRELAAPTLEA